MKKIIKTHAPPTLQTWLDENREQNHSYQALLGTDAHRALKSKLLDEQGKLCAYTGRVIDSQSSHIEHLKPQDRCEEWEDVDYKNVVACFPANGGDESYGYGAPVKRGWWNQTLFVSPLTEECERRFRYKWSGLVNSSPEGHEAADATIEVLGLNNAALRELRKSRIGGFFGFGSRTYSKPLSKRDAQIALRNIERPDENGHLQEFCFVLKQLLTIYIGQEAGE
jgi:uncharacterized protein (TIGR02646 family)